MRNGNIVWRVIGSLGEGQGQLWVCKEHFWLCGDGEVMEECLEKTVEV